MMVQSSSEEASRSKSLVEKASRNKSEEIHLFWSRFRREIAAWTERLDAVRKEEKSTPSLGVQEGNDGEGLKNHRTQLRSKLSQLQIDLDKLRQHCLSSTTQFDDWVVPEEYPLADLRILHSEFTKQATHLEKTRNLLLPKAKFVFKRYRQACLENALSSENSPSSSSQEGHTINQLEPSEYHQKDHHSLLGGDALRGVSNSNVVVDANGNVSIQEEGNDRATNVKSLSGNDNRNASIIIQDVQQSKLLLQGQYSQVHMVKLAHCTIEITCPIQGAVHITECSNLVVTVQSQQLRIHGSMNLKFFAKFHAGAIVEDSSGIVFNLPVGDLDKVDIKDFNWLRNGIPSPNFRVVGVDSCKPDSSQDARQQQHTNQKSDPQSSKVQHGTDENVNERGKLLVMDERISGQQEQREDKVNSSANPVVSDDEDEI